MTLNTFVAGNPGSVRALADSIRELGAGVEEDATGFYRARSDSEAGWEGQASEAFRGVADRNARDADELARLHGGLANALQVFADDLSTVRARMEQAKSVALGGELRVLGDAIFPPATFTAFPPEPRGGHLTAAESAALADAAREYERVAALHAKQEAAYKEAEATINDARAKERAAHDQLLAALRANSTGLDGIGQRGAWEQAAATATTPAAVALTKAAAAMNDWAANATKATFEQAMVGGPAAVHGMWASLTTEQQADLISRDPMLVGNTDGVPALTRDSVNRSVLMTEAAASPRMDALLKALDRGGVRRLLLGFNPRANAGRGQAILANGDPDTADNVVTNVPGTETPDTDLGSIANDPNSDEIHKIDNIANKARSLDPNHKTAAIDWVNYTSPQFESLTNSPAWGTDANHAKDSLANFQQGLHVTHQGPNQPNYTVVGHSYGSTVVGYAARDGHLPDTNLVFIGSPGVGVDNANQLHEDPHHVWAGHSHGDQIANHTKPYRFSDLGPPDRSVPPDQQWFGRDPASPAFGGQILPVDNTGGHSQYYDLHSDIEGIARIAVGQQQPGS